LKPRSSTCAVFQWMAVGSTAHPATGLLLACQLLLTPGGAWPPLLWSEANRELPANKCLYKSIGSGRDSYRPCLQARKRAFGAEIKALWFWLALSRTMCRVESRAGNWNEDRALGKVQANPKGLATLSIPCWLLTAGMGWLTGRQVGAKEAIVSSLNPLTCQFPLYPCGSVSLL
jgi:hypothetical protein